MSEIVHTIDDIQYHVSIEDQKNGWAKIVTNYNVASTLGRTIVKYVRWVDLIEFMMSRK